MIRFQRLKQADIYTEVIPEKNYEIMEVFKYVNERGIIMRFRMLWKPGVPEFSIEREKEELVKSGMTSLKQINGWLVIDQEITDKEKVKNFRPFTLSFGPFVKVQDDEKESICLVDYFFDRDFPGFQKIRFGDTSMAMTIRYLFDELLREMNKEEITKTYDELYETFIEKYDDEIDEMFDDYESGNLCEKYIRRINILIDDFDNNDEELIEIFHSGPQMNKLYDLIMERAQKCTYEGNNFIPSIAWEEKGLVRFSKKVRPIIEELNKVVELMGS